jgi:hypothetical protein
MSLLPIEMRAGAQGERSLAVLERALKAARIRLKRRHTLEIALATLALPVFGAALWIGLSRFTLIDIPQALALAFILLWFVGLFVVSRTYRVGTGEAARYLDRTLGLDERFATCVELARSSPLTGLKGRKSPLPDGLVEDTVFQVKARQNQLPSPWRARMRRRQAGVITFSILALSLSMFLPTPLDSVRAERAQLRRAVAEELARVEQLKAQVVERPGLSESSRAGILSELESLEATLRGDILDRSALLAELADTQERLHQLSPESTADFTGLIAAARTVQNAAATAARSSSGEQAFEWEWDPNNFPDLSDLGRAADAASGMATRFKFFSSLQYRQLGSPLSRASGQAASSDAALGQDLLDASKASDVKDIEKGASALQSVGQRFADADQRWQTTQAVEKTMAELDKGRQALAETGTAVGKKGQVGFRRSGAPGAQAGAPGAALSPTQDAQNGAQDSTPSDGHGLSLNGPSALGPKMGGNSPDLLPGQNSGQPGSQGGSQASAGQQGQGAGASGSGSQGGQPGQSGQGSSASGGGNASSGGDGTGGSVQGPITGPITGGGGAISLVSNPAGQGVAGTGTGGQGSGSEGENDSLYVPPANDGGADTPPATVPGQAAPAEPRRDGIEGRPQAGNDSGEETAATDRGPGARSTIRTPYREVIGKYIEQAAQALEEVYIPSDAREYVRDYFTELGK